MKAAALTTHSAAAVDPPLSDARRAHADSPATIPDAFRYFVRRGSPQILIAASVIAVGSRIALGGWTLWDLVPVAILIAIWPVQEWLIHVYILHFKPFTWRGRTIDFAVPRKHRQHHRDPSDLDILFIPLHTYAYTLPFIALIWFGLAPDARLALTGMSTHFLFSLNYEWIHFLVHTRVVPRSSAYRRLWRNHRLHHFKNERYWMGVSRIAADRFLGTSPDPSAVTTSPTCRSLLGEPATQSTPA